MTNRLRASLADLASEATPVDLRGRIHRGARRVARRNQALGVTAGLLLVAGSVATYLTVWPTGAGPDPAITPDPSGTISGPDPDLSNATFTVPTYPGPWGFACPGGERRFADGIADIGPDAKLVIADTPALRGDLDGAPGDETVIMVQCATEGASDNNPLAVRVEAGGAITTLGWVNVDTDGQLLVLDPAEPVEIVDGTVRVVVLYRYEPMPNLEKQTRAYAYQDGRLVQVDGPTSFAPPTTDAAAVDLRNATLYVSTNDEVVNGLPDTYAGHVRISNGSGSDYLQKIVDGIAVGNVRVSVTVVQTVLVATGAWQTPVAVLEVTPADAPPRSIVVAYHHNQLTGYAAQDPWTVFTTPPGAAPPTVTSGTGQLVVTTDDGVRTFQYNPDPAGLRWFEV